MSTPDRKHIIGFNPEIREIKEEPTTNWLMLETVIDEKTGKSYPIYVQPGEILNEYGILDETDHTKNLLEIFSTKDADCGKPMIEAWWPGKLTPQEYLQNAEALYNHEVSSEEIPSAGFIISGPKRTLNIHGIDLPVSHSARFDIKRPFNVKEVHNLQKTYYESQHPETYTRYGWPFTLEEASAYCIETPQVGMLIYEQYDGIIGRIAGNSIYKGRTQKFIEGMEQYCAATKAPFPRGLFSKVFEHVLYDPSQEE